jgi:hypothetical protein
MHTNVCTGIKPATSCVVGDYSHHYAKSAAYITLTLYQRKVCRGIYTSRTPTFSGVHWLSDMIGNTDQNNQV